MVLPAVQAAAAQYPLVWEPNPPSGCYRDRSSFCVEAVLGFSDNATIAFTSTPSATIVEGNATTVHCDTVNDATDYQNWHRDGLVSSRGHPVIVIG
jgi:hypothetical protein